MNALGKTLISTLMSEKSKKEKAQTIIDDLSLFAENNTLCRAIDELVMA